MQAECSEIINQYKKDAMVYFLHQTPFWGFGFGFDFFFKDRTWSCVGIRGKYERSWGREKNIIKYIENFKNKNKNKNFEQFYNIIL